MRAKEMHGGCQGGEDSAGGVARRRREERPTVVLKKLAKWHTRSRETSMDVRDLIATVKGLSNRRSSVNWHKALEKGRIHSEESLC
jgi:hypothetical protein